MAKFRYRMQNILDIKNQMESQAKIEYAQAKIFLNEQEEKPVLDYAHTHGKAILIKKALASGHICLEPGIDPVRASFELIFGHPGTTSAVIGTINPKHLQHNVEQAAAVLSAQLAP